MSLVETQQPPDRQSPPPSLNLNLPPPIPLNNPFLKGASSPAPSPALTKSPPERPVSRNPFLEPSAEMESSTAKGPPRPRTGNGSPADMLGNLTLGDKPNRNEALPPPAGRSIHRPSQSQEASRRTHDKSRPQAQNLDIFADPSDQGKLSERRRNSDSSVADRKPLDPQEERRRRERRHREREHRHRDSKGRPIPSSSGKPPKPGRRLDVIDKLDVTSIYGTGLFHHDGPFDACNPHRNRKGSSRAPMQAFPKDSANNTMGGSGPVNKGINIAQFHGHGAEGFTDYSASGRPGASESAALLHGDARPSAHRTTGFNPTAAVDQVHGSETIGLGTSTFLEGAPAARSAIERRDSEGDTGGLGRKKSLAQKIRGISNSRTNGPRGIGFMPSPEPRFEHTTSPNEMQSAGGLPKINEANPFFNESDGTPENKGAAVKNAEENAGAETKGERRAHERTATSDNLLPHLPDEGKSGGFLNRVKSLRSGGRGKVRPERKE